MIKSLFLIIGLSVSQMNGLKSYSIIETTFVDEEECISYAHGMTIELEAANPIGKFYHFCSYNGGEEYFFPGHWDSIFDDMIENTTGENFNRDDYESGI